MEILELFKKNREFDAQMSCIKFWMGDENCLKPFLDILSGFLHFWLFKFSKSIFCPF
jgi:hypothetical protein